MEESEEELDGEEGLFPPLPHEERIKAARMIRHLDLFIILPFRANGPRVTEGRDVYGWIRLVGRPR